MALIGVRVDERNRQRLDSLCAQILQVCAQRVFVQRGDHLPAGVYAFDGFAGVFQRRGRVRFLHNHPTGEWARRPGARQVEDLLKALGRNQANLGALALQDGVGCHGRPVHNLGDVAG